MKKLLCIALLILLVPAAAQAAPSKADCKARVGTVKQLAKEFAITDETDGRELLDAVNAWIEAQDENGIQTMVVKVEKSTAGIEECESAGHSSRIMPVKPMSRKMSTAVLPWLRSAVVVDPCQSLISEAVGKKDTDPDGAIEDMERAVRECDDELWLREARRRLAETYYERGELEKAHDHTRGALLLGTSYDEADRSTFTATLAKSAIEAGQGLMEQAVYDRAKLHWTAYREIFGTESFDVLFDVEAVAKDAWRLRELGDARRQLAMACLELHDADCVRAATLATVDQYAEDDRPLQELATRAMELACGGAEAGNAGQRLAFDLLDAWHQLDPGSFQIGRLLDEHVVTLADEERLDLLRSTDKCWIPLHVAEELKNEDRAYLEDMEVAAACGGASAEAGSMVADFYMREAQNRIDRIGILGTVGERRVELQKIESELLPKIADAGMADEIRARLSQAEADLQRATARSQRDLGSSFATCTEMLAVIQWNQARENDNENEERAFKKDCCRFLKSNASGWGNWMRSRPAGQRLADAEIQKKERLMQGYCP